MLYLAIFSAYFLFKLLNKKSIINNNIYERSQAILILVFIFSIFGFKILFLILPVMFILILQPDLLTNYFDKNLFSQKSQNNDQNLSIDEAYKLFDISKDATLEEVTKKYKELMFKYHPDRGGSNYFASKINESYNVIKQYNNWN